MVAVHRCTVMVVVITAVAALLTGVGSLVIAKGFLLAPLPDLRQDKSYCHSVLVPDG
jgi:hypothetical protein